MRDRTLLVLAGITLLAAALRFPALDVQSYWNDEAVTVSLLDQGLGGLLADIPDSESTPPLYYVLAWVWTQVFGAGEVGLRSLSALFGTAAVPVVYAAASTLVSRRAGLAAAALVAANPLLVWYSQEARAYALLVLLSALSLLFFARTLDESRSGESPRGSDLAAWGAVGALALATHYFALFVVLPQAIWLLAAHGVRRTALAALTVPAAAGLALLPLALHQRSNNAAAFIEDSSLGLRLAQIPKQWLVGFDAPAEELVTALAAGLAALGLLLLLRAGPRESRGAAIAAVLGGAGALVPVALAFVGVDFLITRNLIAALVPLLVVLAAGFGVRRAGRAGPLAAAALCALSTLVVVWVASEPRFQRDDWRGAAEALGPPERDRAIVITPVDGRTPMLLYLDGAASLEPGTPASEIDVLGLGKRRPGQPPDPPRADPPPPAAGFERFARVETPTYTLLRYRAPEPAGLTPLGVEAGRLAEFAAAVLFQPARR